MLIHPNRYSHLQSNTDRLQSIDTNVWSRRSKRSCQFIGSRNWHAALISLSSVRNQAHLFAHIHVFTMANKYWNQRIRDGVNRTAEYAVSLRNVCQDETSFAHMGLSRQSTVKWWISYSMPRIAINNALVQSGHIQRRWGFDFIFVVFENVELSKFHCHVSFEPHAFVSSIERIWFGFMEFIILSFSDSTSDLIHHQRNDSIHAFDSISFEMV